MKKKWIAAAAVFLFGALALCFGCATDVAAEKRTVTFRNGDEVFAEQEVTLGEKYSFPDETPSREQPDDEHRYTFVGWTLDANYYEYRSELIEAPEEVYADLSVYAVFRLEIIDGNTGDNTDIPYRVEFRMPRGEDFGEQSGVLLEEQTVYRHGDATIPDPDDMPVIKGYHFTGKWEGGSLTDVRGHRRVTAVYEKNIYKYVWHYLDQTVEREAEYREKIDLTQTPEADSAFKFEGWFTDSDRKTPATLTEMPDGDVHLYAKHTVDFSVVTVSKEGNMVYGDPANNLFIAGLKEAEGLEYSFRWTVNGSAGDVTVNSSYPLKDAGTYHVAVHVFANYKDGVLTDEGDASVDGDKQSTVFEIVLEQATLTAELSISSHSVVYGSPVPQATITYSGFMFGETAESVGVREDFVYLQDGEEAGPQFHVGTYSVEARPHALRNYKFAPIEQPAFEVTKKQLDVSVSFAGGVYGVEFAPTFAFEGFEYEESENVLGEHWFTEGAERLVGGERLNAGAHSVKLFGFASDDYDVRLPAEETHFTIDKRTASATLSAEGGIYGVSPELGYAFDNVLDDDKGKFTPAYSFAREGTAYPDTARFIVGNYTVTATFTEEGSDNYAPLTVTGTHFTITKKALTVGVSVRESYLYGETVSPSLVFRAEEFAFDENERTPGFLTGTLRYIYRTAAAPEAEYSSPRHVVDSYTVEASGYDSANYALSFPKTSFEVTQKALTLTVHLQSDSLLYGERPAPASAFAALNGVEYNGFIAGETPNTVFGNKLPTISYQSESGEPQSEFHAGSYVATTGAELRNYAVSVVPARFTVRPRTLYVGISLVKAALVYGEKPQASVVYTHAGYDGFLEGEQSLAAGAYLEYSGAETYTQSTLSDSATKMIAGSYALSVKGIPALDDYTLTYQQGVTVSVARRALTVTLTEGSGVYTYGDTPKVTVTFGAFAYDEDETSLFGERASTILYFKDGAAEQYAVKKYFDAGSYTATLQGLENANYTVDVKDASFTVNKKLLTVTVTAGGFTYGDQDRPAPALGYNGFVPEEDENVLGGEPVYTYLRAREDYSDRPYFDAGSYTVSVKGYSSDNYQIEYQSGNFTVARRTAVATLSAQGGTYGDTPAVSYSAPAVLARDLDGFGFRYTYTFSRTSNGGKTEYTPANYAHYQAGWYQVTLTYTANDNYTFSVRSATFRIEKKPLTVGVDGVDGSYVYGNVPSPELTFRGFVGDEGESQFTARPEEPFTYYEESGRSTNVRNFPVGSYSVGATEGYTADNYTVSSEEKTPFRVTKADLTVTVKAEDIVYGGTPNPTVSYSPFAFGEDARVLKGSANYTYFLGEAQKDGLLHAGKYTVKVDGFTSANYDIRYVSGNFTVAQKQLTVSATVANITYGEEPVPSVTYRGLIPGESADDLQGELVCTYSDAKNSKGFLRAGEHTLTLSGYLSDDYAISYETATFRVSPKPITVSVTDENNFADSIYDGSRKLGLSSTVEGLVDGDTVEGLGSLRYVLKGTRNPSADVNGVLHADSYTFTASGYSSEDYTVSYVYGTERRDEVSFTVSPTEVRLSLKDGWSVYGDDTEGEWLTATGSVYNEELTFTTSIDKDGTTYTGKDLYLPCGKYTVTVSYDVNPDYRVTSEGAELEGSVSVTFTVAPKSVRISASGTQPWAKRSDWAYVPTLDDDRFVLTGTIVLNNPAGLDAKDYHADSVGDVFVWQTPCKITLKDSSVEVTDNFTFTYAFNLTLSNSDFRIEKPSESTVSYDSREHSFQVTATAEGVDTKDITIEYKTEEEGVYSASVPAFINAGTYTVYFKVTADNCKPEEGNFTVTVNRATPDLKAATDSSVYVYNKSTHLTEETVRGAVIRGNVYHDATVEYSLDALGFGAFPQVTDAGSYTITVKVSGDNYNEKSETYSFVIAKATVEVPEIAHKTYNKEPQKADVDTENALYTVRKNDGGTAAGSYDVVLALTDGSNYKWAGHDDDEESAVLTLTFVIDKATLDMGSVKWNYVEGAFTYDKTAHSVALTGLPEEGDIEVVYQQESGTAAGEYHAVATLTYDDTNYNDITTEWTLTWNIAKANYTVSAVTDDAGYTYNGAAQGRTAEALKALIEALEGDEFEVKFVGNNQFTGAGDHPVKYTVTGNSNYHDIEEGTYTVKIAQAQAAIDTSAITFGDLAKNDEYTYSATYKGAAYTVDWKAAKPADDFHGTLTKEHIHVVGASSFTNYRDGGYTITLTIDGTDNYKGASLTYTVNINKATPVVSEGDGSFTYDTHDKKDEIAQNFTATGVFGDDYTVKYRLAEGEWQDSLPAITNAGTYQIGVQISGANYETVEESFSVTVAKAEFNTESVTDPAAVTYNGKPQGRTLDELKRLVTALGSDGFEVTFEGEGQFTDAGEHTVTYKVSGNDNYAEKTGTYTVNINKAQAQLDVAGITTEYTFTAAEQSVNLSAAKATSGIVGADGYGEITFEKDGTLITEFKFTNVGEGNGVTITVKLADGKNFTGTEETITLTVAKANYTVNAPAQNYDYDATEHGEAITVSGLAGDALQAGDYTVTYNGEKSVAKYKNYQDGGYTVQYAVSASKNYNAANGSYKITINKAKPTLDGFTDEKSYTYDKDTETQVDETTVRSAVVKDNVFGDETVEYSLTGSAFGAFPNIKNAGSYTITVRVSGDNYETRTATYTLTVARKTVTVEKLTDIETTYDGKPHNHEVNVNLDGDTRENVVQDINYVYSVGGSGVEETPNFTDVGTYSVTVTVTPTSNYTFGDGIVFSTNYTVTINKAQAVIDTSDIDFGELTGEGDARSATYKGTPYTVDWTAAKPADDFNGTLTEEIQVSGDSSFTDANTYTVTLTLAGNDNYEGDTKVFTITIDKAKAVIDTSAITFGDLVKGGDEYTYSATYRGTPYPVDWSKATSNFGTVTFNETEIKNAATYTVTLSVAETPNYEGDTKEFTITINKAKAVAPDEKPTKIEDVLRAKGKTLGEVELSAPYFWVNAGEELGVQPSRTAQAYYNPDSANYENSDPFAVTITTIKTTITVNENAVYGVDWAETFDEAAFKTWFFETACGLSAFDIDLNLNSADTKIGSTYLSTFTLPAVMQDYYEFSTGEISVDIVFKIKSVDVGGTLYTIEDALETAQNGTVTVKHDTAFATQDIADRAGYKDGCYTVKANVTLLLPYDGGSAWNGTPGTNSSGTNTMSFGNANNCKLTLQIPESIVLTNHGTINVGGYTTGSSGGATAGQTFGDYAKIELGEAAKIDSYGNINAYGFIVEAAQNNSSEVHMHTGTLTMPFIVVEFRGGSAYFGIYGNMQGTPFNRFMMHNVTSKLIVESLAKLNGHANLHTGTPNQDNTTDIQLIGSDTSHLIQLLDDARLEAKLQAKAFDTNNAVVETKVDIYGNMKLNAMTLEISALGQELKLSTASVFFPLSWQWQVSLNKLGDQNVTADLLSQKIKLLPGASLTIGEGVIATASEIAVYGAKDWTDTKVSAPSVYPNKDDASLTVNGTLNIDVLGGKISSKHEGAEVKVGTTSVVTHELTSASMTSSKWTDISLTLMPVNSDNTINDAASGTWYYKDNVWVGPDTQFEIDYAFVFKDAEGNVQKEESVPINPNPSIRTPGMGSFALQPASCEGWTFIGWFTDEACSEQNAIGQISGTLYDNCQLFGLFQKVDAYVISYNTEYPDDYTLPSDKAMAIGSETVLAQDIQTFDPKKYDDIMTKYDYDVNVQYYFDGWYVDRQLTKEYSLDNLKEMYGETTGATPVNLYAKWTKKVTLTINLEALGEYGFLSPGATKTASVVVTFSGTDFSLQKSVTSEGGSMFTGGPNKQTDTITIYLKPEQTYTISSHEGTLSGTANGTAEAGKDITITVSNT